MQPTLYQTILSPHRELEHRIRYGGERRKVVQQEGGKRIVSLLTQFKGVNRMNLQQQSANLEQRFMATAEQERGGRRKRKRSSSRRKEEEGKKGGSPLARNERSTFGIWRTCHYPLRKERLPQRSSGQFLHRKKEKKKKSQKLTRGTRKRRSFSHLVVHFSQIPKCLRSLEEKRGREKEKKRLSRRCREV